MKTYLDSINNLEFSEENKHVTVRYPGVDGYVLGQYDLERRQSLKASARAYAEEHPPMGKTAYYELLRDVNVLEQQLNIPAADCVTEYVDAERIYLTSGATPQIAAERLKELEVLAQSNEVDRFNTIPDQRQDQEPEPVPVHDIADSLQFYGRIDFMNGNGTVGETLLYDDRAEYDQECRESQNVGRPIQAKEISFEEYRATMEAMQQSQEWPPPAPGKEQHPFYGEIEYPDGRPAQYFDNYSEYDAAFSSALEYGQNIRARAISKEAYEQKQETHAPQRVQDIGDFDNVSFLETLKFNQQFPYLSYADCQNLQATFPNDVSFMATEEQFNRMGYEVKEAESPLCLSLESGNLYDISQTDCPKSEYVLHSTPAIATKIIDEKIEQMTFLCEKCRIPVFETELENAAARYNAETNTIYLNSDQNIHPNDKMDALCIAYAESLVENTSTQPANIQKLEQCTLYISICHHLGHTYDSLVEDVVIKDILEQSPDLGKPEIDGVLLRTHKMLGMIANEFSQGLGAIEQTRPRSTAPTHTMDMAPQQAAGISENFTIDL